MGNKFYRIRALHIPSLWKKLSRMVKISQQRYDVLWSMLFWWKSRFPLR